MGDSSWCERAPGELSKGCDILKNGLRDWAEEPTHQPLSISKGHLILTCARWGGCSSHTSQDSPSSPPLSFPQLQLWPFSVRWFLSMMLFLLHGHLQKHKLDRSNFSSLHISSWSLWSSQISMHLSIRLSICHLSVLIYLSIIYLTLYISYCHLSSVCLTVLAVFLLLWLKHHDESNLQKNCLFRLMIPERQEIVMVGKHGSKQAWWLERQDESSHLEQAESELGMVKSWVFQLSKFTFSVILPPKRPFLPSVSKQYHSLGTTHSISQDCGGHFWSKLPHLPII